MASGIEMMLKSFGFDPKKLIDDFEQLKNVTQQTLQNIDARLERIENQNAQILTRQQSIYERQEEIWKANQTALRMSSQVQLVQPPSVQSQPPEQQPEQRQQPEQPQQPPNLQPLM